MAQSLTARLIVHAYAASGLIDVRAIASLEADGVHVLVSEDWNSLRKLSKAYPADAVIVVFESVDGKGEVVARIRRLFGRSALPVLVLLPASAPAGSEAAMLTVGANDALRASADPGLLLARLEAAVRNAETASAPAVWPRHVLRVDGGRLVLDVRARRCLLRRNKAYVDVTLTRRQFETLAALLRSPNRPVSWREFYRRGWRPSKLRKRSRTLVQHILSLRRKLGGVGARIEAMPGYGYIFRENSNIIRRKFSRKLAGIAQRRIRG